jgi:hypothetical protein
MTKKQSDFNDEYMNSFLGTVFKEISDTAEAHWHLSALAYLKALKKGYIAYQDKIAIDQIDKSLYHLEKSVKRAFESHDAQRMLIRSEEIANKAHAGSKVIE